LFVGKKQIELKKIFENSGFLKRDVLKKEKEMYC